jgi:ParB family chromosome partitioning protein
LGRGLDALLANTESGDAPSPGAGTAAVREVDVAAIDPNPFQPRQHIDEGALQELAASVKSHGLIQPLLVTASDDANRFTLIAGERRWRAAQLAGLTTVPVVVRDATDEQMLALAIIENVQRSDLNAIEAAEGYRRLIDVFGLTQVEVADLVGKSRPAVANTLRLLGLPDDVRHLVADGHLAEGHARALLVVTEPTDQLALARRAISDGWSVRRVETEARRLVESDTGEATTGAPRATGSKDADTLAAEKALERRLETRVEIRRRGGVGQIVVHFYSDEELNALFDRLGGAT